jgi:hypothetical protein
LLTVVSDLPSRRNEMPSRKTDAGRVWVTRPRPYVDRLACAWLIRRFVDAEAQIHYSDTPKKDELSFDMKEAVFGHRGNFCSFEMMMRSFGITDDAVKSLAEIIHEIDLRDGRYIRKSRA